MVAWTKARKTVENAELVKAAQVYAMSKKGVEAQYIKHASTWLNGGCWDDEPDARVLSAGEQMIETGFGDE